MSEEQPVWSVGELVADLREWLGGELGVVRVAGEIASVHVSRAGHVYFDLIDPDASLRCVMFRREALMAPEPEPGQHVQVSGVLDVYAARGSLQLRVHALRRAGAGDLRAAFEALRARLEAEGLFDPAHKQPLPAAPRRIGLVTSTTGAAIHDFVRGLRRRRFSGELLVVDARVQGDGAWRELARGLQLLDARGDVDVIVLARGGGSLEDLWAFNAEPLVRAVFDARTPVVSAVGHEIDVVLTDAVADLRAATPSAAAEAVVPDGAPRLARLRELTRRLERGIAAALPARRERAHALERRLSRAIEHELRARRLRCDGLAARLVDPAARISAARGRLRAADARLERAGVRALERRRARWQALAGQLNALSPLGVLQRGYSIAQRASDGAVVRRHDEVSKGDALAVRLADGSLRATVTDTAEDP